MSLFTRSPSFPLCFSDPLSLFPLSVFLSVSTLIIIGSIKDIYIPSSLTLHSWAGKTLPISKDPVQAGHKFSPPKSQNSISLKNSWRLPSGPAMQNVFYEFEDWKRFFTGLHLLMKRSVSLSGRGHDHGGFLWWERLPLRCYSGGPISSPQGCHQSCQVRSSCTSHFRPVSWCSFPKHLEIAENLRDVCL